MTTRNLYLKSDLRNILKAAALAAANGNRGTEYGDGFDDALTMVAAALGLEPPVAERRTITVERPKRLLRAE